MAELTKAWRDGGRRTCSPQETWSRLKPLLPVFGIARVANITGLDRIGIPVFTACRPNSRSLSVFQGKGLSTGAARVSAVMEAYETWCAESIDAPLKFASIDELQFSHPLIGPLHPGFIFGTQNRHLVRKVDFNVVLGGLHQSLNQPFDVFRDQWNATALNITQVPELELYQAAFNAR